MRKAIISGLALLAIAAAGSGIARAQDDCKGVVKLDTIYGSGTPLEYRVQVRNETDKTVTGQLTFGGFASGVKITRQLVTFTLKPHANERVLIGNGTDQHVNSSTVDFVYGRADGPSKPAFVRVTSCRVM